MKDTLKKYFQKKSIYTPQDCDDVRERLQKLFGVYSAPQVAVVIPVKNEYPGIKDTLASLSVSSSAGRGLLAASDEHVSAGSASLSVSAQRPTHAADSSAHETRSQTTQSAGAPSPEKTTCNLLHVVCVVNSREDDDGDVKKNNSQMLAFLSTCVYENLFISVIDRTSSGQVFPEKEGVGLARKIGMDYALACGAEIIASMDADTLVAENYAEELFRFAENHGKRSFALVPFRHQKAADEKLQQAIDAYENYMMRHSQKLRETGTPYWAPVLGPSLVCTADGYVSCGGMNKRVSGEDFYFLQSLVKIEISAGFAKIRASGLHFQTDCAQSRANTAQFCSDVAQSRETSDLAINYSPCFLNTEVYPSARISDRVLFGTGPKLRQLTDANLQKTKIECPIYPDRCYEAIKEFIEKKESCQNELAGFMNKENFLSVWNKICENNPSNLNGRETAFHIWFDGLKIIRAIHAVQAIL